MPVPEFHSIIPTSQFGAYVEGMDHTGQNHVSVHASHPDMLSFQNVLLRDAHHEMPSLTDQAQPHSMMTDSHLDMSFWSSRQTGNFHHSQSEHVSYSSPPTTGVLLPAHVETFVLGDNWQDRGMQRSSEHQEYLRSIARVDGNFPPMDGFIYDSNTSMHGEHTYFPFSDRMTKIQQKGKFGINTFYHMILLFHSLTKHPLKFLPSCD
jgi:hypothetical protein